MEYTVGSLADLITGKNTPNKPKVIQKEFKVEIDEDLTPSKSRSTKVKTPKSPPKHQPVDNILENSTTPSKKSPKVKTPKGKTLKIKNLNDDFISFDDPSILMPPKSESTPSPGRIKKNTSPKEEYMKLKASTLNKADKKVFGGSVSPKKTKSRKSKSHINHSAPGINNSDSNEERRSLKKKQKSYKRKLDTTEDAEASDENGNFDSGAEETPKKKKKRSKKTHKHELDTTEDAEASAEDSDRNDILDSDAEETPKEKRKLSKNEQNAERRVKKKEKTERQQNPEELARTIFVGNVPINLPKKKLYEHFRKCGKIESIRIRCIPLANPKTPKKVAAIKKDFHPNRHSVVSYIRFLKKVSAVEAEKENGALLEDHHIRVHLCSSEQKPDEAKAIFVGNLSFDAEEDELWKLFESCGSISYVRIVRDRNTRIGKGFAYVNFHDSDSVQLALEMGRVELKGRELRLSLCNLNKAKKNKKMKKYMRLKESGKLKQRRPFKKNRETSDDTGDSEKPKQQFGNKFQGTKFTDKAKKRKVNKGLQGKNKLVKKIAPKPK